MKKIIPIIGLVVIATACNSEAEETIEENMNTESTVEMESEADEINETSSTTADEVQPLETEQSKPSEWTYEVVSISDGNWGYQLFQHGKMVINQTTIPSVQGNNAFDSEEKAERTAKHILHKLENGIFPPTVDQKELEELGVLSD